MLSYPEASAAAEGRLLRVNQTVANARKPGNVGRRLQRRQFARAASRIERNEWYRRSLAGLAELAASLEAELVPEQRCRWLALEEALHEHVATLTRAYFHAGTAWGEELAGSGQARRAPRADVGEPVARGGLGDRELIVRLAELVLELARG